MAPSVLPIWWCLLCLGALPAFDTTATVFTDIQKNTFVQAHNRLRTTASPQVANMNFMIWDNDLEKLAKDWAGKCPQERKDISDLKPAQAVNLYLESTVDAVLSNKKLFSEQCDYQNIMWPSTDKIGCATKQDCSAPKKSVVLCVYNKPEDKPKEGWPCSRCPAASTKCLAGLCAAATVDTAKKTNLLDPKADEFTLDTVPSSECRHDCGGAGVGTLDTNTCKCTCSTVINFGRKCQHPQAKLDASVRLKISSDKTRVSQSLFNEKIWVKLKAELAVKANTHCGGGAYATCCPATGGAGAAQAGKPYATFEIIDSTIGNECDGTLYLNVHGTPITTGGAKLCEKVPPPFVPRAVVIDVLTQALAALRAEITAEGLTIAPLSTPVPTTSGDTVYSKPCGEITDCTPKSTPTSITTPKSNIPEQTVKPVNPGSPGNPGDKKTTPPSADKGNLASRTAAASLAHMLISCICTVALLCVQSMAF